MTKEFNFFLLILLFRKRPYKMVDPVKVDTLVSNGHHFDGVSGNIDANVNGTYVYEDSTHTT